MLSPSEKELNLIKTFPFTDADLDYLTKIFINELSTSDMRIVNLIRSILKAEKSPYRYETVHQYIKKALPHERLFSACYIIKDEIFKLAFERLPCSKALDTIKAFSKHVDNELSLLMGSYLKMHEEYELQTLQELIVGNMPVNVLCLGESGEVNAATRTHILFNMPGGTQLEDHLPFELMEEADLLTRIGQALSTDQEVVIPRVTIGNGFDSRQFKITIVPLKHPNARALLHIEEITDVIREEANAQQLESLARIGELASSIAHEVRNPLSAISLTMQVFEGSLQADDNRRQIIDKVQDQVSRLDRLVNELLHYAKPPSPNLTKVDLVELAIDSVSGVSEITELKVQNPEMALADPLLIKQIITNILYNAREATRGSITILVGPGPSITISDDGPGVSKEILYRLFEPFVSTKTYGTGLGLAIALKLARSMGGSITHSNNNPGASFTLTFSSFPNGNVKHNG